jgi:hypothetical protein
MKEEKDNFERLGSIAGRVDGRSPKADWKSNATRISHPFGPTHTLETAVTERCPGLALRASDHGTPLTALGRPMIPPLLGLPAGQAGERAVSLSRGHGRGWPKAG